MTNEGIKTSEIALTSHFDLKTVEDFGAHPRICIIAEVVIDKGKVHHVNTAEIKETIEASIMTSVWLYAKGETK